MPKFGAFRHYLAFFSPFFNFFLAGWLNFLLENLFFFTSYFQTHHTNLAQFHCLQNRKMQMFSTTPISG